MKSAWKLLMYALVLGTIQLSVSYLSKEKQDPDFQKPQVYVTRGIFMRTCVTELVKEKNWNTLQALCLWAKNQPATLWGEECVVFPGWRKK